MASPRLGLVVEDEAFEHEFHLSWLFRVAWCIILMLLLLHVFNHVTLITHTLRLAGMSCCKAQREMVMWTHCRKLTLPEFASYQHVKKFLIIIWWDIKINDCMSSVAWWDVVKGMHYISAIFSTLLMKPRPFPHEIEFRVPEFNQWPLYHEPPVVECANMQEAVQDRELASLRMKALPNPRLPFSWVTTKRPENWKESLLEPELRDTFWSTSGNIIKYLKCCCYWEYRPSIMVAKKGTAAAADF